MHIPDGYLGPQTYLTAFGVMVPVWAWASSRLKKTLSQRKMPLMALAAAFTFVVMMFNVPIPGGTTGHAVGGVLVAILLGPWAAVVAVSVTLAVQALLFGDGGVTALGANCLTMAFVMPFAGWWTYRLLAGASPAASKRRCFSAAVAGYVGLNAAALGTAILFGIQPSLARDASGRALFCPFDLTVAVPAMAIGHLLFFGVVEAAATGLVLAYLSRTDPSLVPEAALAGPKGARMHRWRKLALGLGALVLLTPLGLLVPAKFGAGEAWGEWGGERLRELAGYLPAGLQKLESIWNPPVPDYAPAGAAAGSLAVLSTWYVVSGILGVAAVAGLIFLGRRWLTRGGTDGFTP